MSRYVRPVIADQTFRDANGEVIEYGKNRWGSDGPPPDSYSVDSHPERFAPLHPVADALIDHLQRNYDVEVADDMGSASVIRYAVEVVRAVRLTPLTQDAAPLIFAFTSYPALIVHAGLLHDFVYPVCGCDACDESVATVADELERTVLAIVDGGYREGIDVSPDELWIWYELAAADGARSGRDRVDAATGFGAHVQASSVRLSTLGGWAAWPRRVSDAGQRHT